MSVQARRASFSYLPYVLILAFTLLLMAAPYFVKLPIPETATETTSARLSFNGGPEQAVELPHRWPRLPASAPVRAVYRLSVEIPTGGGYLLIPAAQQEIAAQLNEQRLGGTQIYISGEPSVGAPYMLRIPDGMSGTADLVITLTRESGVVPGYLSRVHVADESSIADVRWAWLSVTSGMRISVLGLQAIVITALATVWLARRGDPIFAWLFIIGGGSLLYSLANSPASGLVSPDGQPYIVFVMPSFGLMALGLAQAVAGIPRPRWLKIAIVGLPLALTAGVWLEVVPSMVGVLVAALVAIGGHIFAALLLTRDALRCNEWDRALLAVPFFLVAWYGLRDLGIVIGLIDGALLLSGKIRLVTMIAVITLLMRRLVSSLDALDHSNETLRLRLAAQEEELSELHAKEKALTAQTIREQERSRLTRDLHDGLSGHLVSIIALSQEREGDPKAIERAARGALDDLRLVINSLDLDDGDLLVALADLRERIEPQLRRVGMELDWSMENLPPVDGFKPSSALSILRIVQEAITNAVKHGMPGRIAVHGSAGRGETIVVRIANEARSDVAQGHGHGLRNMQRRAAELGGAVNFHLTDGMATLRMVLPSKL